MSNNGTCDLEFRVRERTQSYREYSLAWIIFVLVFIAINLLLWYRKRKHIVLVKRRMTILLFVVFSVIAQLWVGAVVRFAGPVGPCEIYLVLYIIISVYCAWPILARLILWINEVRLNWYIAENMSNKSLDAKNNPEFRRLRFRASNRFGLLLILAVYGPAFIMALALVLGADICNPSNCNEGFLADPVTLYFNIALLVFIIVSVIYLFYKYRNVPDLVGIWRESLFACVIPSSFSTIFLGFAFLDVGGFGEAEVSNFEWGSVVDVGVLFFFVTVITVPLIRVYRMKGFKEPDKSFQELLDDPRGAKYFEFYTATELSLENYLFYREATAWKNDYDNVHPDERNAKGDLLLNKYVRPWSDMEVNLGSSMREEILSQAEASARTEYPRDLFDNAVVEIYSLMYSHSYPNFKRSSFYKLYLGETDASSFGWVLQAGIAGEVTISQRLTF